MLLLVLAEVGNTEAQKWTQHMLESGARSGFYDFQRETEREKERERERERERKRKREKERKGRRGRRNFGFKDQHKKILCETHTFSLS